MFYPFENTIPNLPYSHFTQAQLGSPSTARAKTKSRPQDATKLIANFETGFLSVVSRRQVSPNNGNMCPQLFDSNCLSMPWNIWESDINYLAHIPIIVHAYLQVTLRSMHALSSPPGINLVTHHTQESRYNCNGAYTQGTDAQLTPRNDRAAPRA